MKRPQSLVLICLFLLPLSVAAGEAGPLALEMKNPKWLEGGLTTGGQPSRQDLEALAAAGYKTVINLRLPGETTKVTDPARKSDFNFDEADYVAGLGMNYLNLPIDGADGLTRESAAALAALLEATDGPVLLHCASGNRAGSLLALKAFYVDGKPAGEAYARGLAGGMTGYAEHVEKLLQSATDQ